MLFDARKEAHGLARGAMCDARPSQSASVQRLPYHVSVEAELECEIVLLAVAGAAGSLVAVGPRDTATLTREGHGSRGTQKFPQPHEGDPFK